jgi:hypothetical protein
MNLSPMDYTLIALLQAKDEGLTLDDLIQCAQHAESAETFSDAVNLLSTMTPEDQKQ